MVPSVVMKMERLPLTLNGKADRRALPEPEIAMREEQYVAPRTHAEEQMLAVWCEVMNARGIGMFNNFLELGGYSLLGARLVARVSEVFQVKVPLRALFENPTPAGLMEEVERLRADLPTAGEAYWLESLDDLSEDEFDAILEEVQAEG